MAAHYKSRHHEVGDPTAAAVSLQHAISVAREHWAAEKDPVQQHVLREAILDAEAALLELRHNPSSGRLSQLDEGFRAMGYRDNPRD